MADAFAFSLQVEIPADVTAALKAAAGEALMEVAGELTGRFTDAINGNYWPWPRQSKRGVGGSTLRERAKAWKAAPFNTGTTRDINDSGDLGQSMVFDLDLSNLSAEWVWTAEYAAAVHDGAWIHPWGDRTKAKVQLPARPWTTAVLQGGTAGSVEVYDFAGEIAKRIPLFYGRR